MDLLRRQLKMMRASRELHPITRVAAQVALHVLDKYLKLTEDSVVPWIAVGMYAFYFCLSLSSSPIRLIDSFVSLAQTRLVRASRI